MGVEGDTTASTEPLPSWRTSTLTSDVEGCRTPARRQERQERARRARRGHVVLREQFAGQLVGIRLRQRGEQERGEPVIPLLPITKQVEASGGGLPAPARRRDSVVDNFVMMSKKATRREERNRPPRQNFTKLQRDPR